MPVLAHRRAGARRGAARLVACVTAAVALHATAAAGAPAPIPKPVVIAVVGEAGLNLLHEDFALAATPPAPPGMPRARTVTLPRHGTFDQRVAAAREDVLGRLAPGQLYRIAHSRVLAVINAGGREEPVDLFADADHGTGVVSAAVGRRHGTAPGALVVLVLGSSDAAWQWVAAQPWIDLVSASYFGVGSVQDGTRTTCVEGRAIRALTARGRPVFVATGNGEGAGTAASPSGHPDAYHVGGVTRDGRTWLPQDRGDGAVSHRITPNRPYDTGELFAFPAAAADSLTGEREFGGTSGAAPRTAGDAALLVAEARRILRSPHGDAPGGALARAGRGVRPPARGPLRDGALTRDELQRVMRHTAVPYFSSPEGYAVEGYGAITPTSVRHAIQVLRGVAEEPRRDAEDAFHANVDAVRRGLYPEIRCNGAR